MLLLVISNTIKSLFFEGTSVYFLECSAQPFYEILYSFII